MRKNISLIDLKSFVSGKFFAALFLLLPQLFLFAVNANSFYISSQNQFSILTQNVILGSFLLEALPFVFSSLIFIESVLNKEKKMFVPLVLNVFLLLSSCAFMVFFYFVSFEKIVTVDSKLIIKDHILYLQFACMASSVIYPLLRASLWRIEKSSLKEIIIVSVSGILFPVLWFTLFGIVSTVYGCLEFFSSKIIGISFIAMFCGCSISSIIAIVRVFSFLIMKTEKYKLQRNLVIGLFAGLLLPFAGLFLNYIVPFPGNFQYPEIYALTFINAFVVTVPESKNRIINICISAVRVILIPFIIYFFIILSPVVSFSFLLILILGFGFIPLSPVFLLLIHISKLRKDYISYSSEFGKLKVSLAAAVLLLVLPALFTAKKYIEYQILENASKYVLSDKINEDLKYPCFMVNESLLNFYRDKTGKGLPVLSAITVQISDKTLPQNRIDELFQVFFGKPASAVLSSSERLTELAVFGNRTYNARDSLILTKERIISDASIKSVEEIMSSEDGNGEKHSIKITMKEQTGQSRNEGFRGKIIIPDGVFVSGLKLKIGDKFEQGRIYEKTSAIWVFNEIKRRLQDPAVIYYLSDNELRFDVFPFGENEIRECIVEFTCPKGSLSKIRFKYQMRNSDNPLLITKTLNSEKVHESKVFKSTNDFGTVFYIPESIAGNIKTEMRKPVLFIIADWSKDSQITKEKILSTAESVKNDIPEIENVSICFTNYLPNVGKVIPFAKLKDDLKDLEEELFAKKGGFFYKKAFRKISDRYELSETEFPVFAIVTSSTEDIITEDESLSALLPPDMKGFYLTSDGNSFCHIPERTGKGVRRVYFGNGSSSLFEGKDSILYFAENNKSDNISYTDIKGNFRKLYAENAEGIIKTAFDLYSEDKIKGNSDGEVFKSFIESSKKSGIITSSTSYIVVENENQWKQLEDKEKEILDNEYAQTYNSPEPGALAVISVLVIVLGLMKLKRRRLSR
ncbi:MAG TPA: MSEP-CTERM sorting domain-containing protein [Spirochaetota bacterium]|nr:MSEP-CTERM sorting domain-containing protein [Spirochaetota bacterium]HQA53085.1 MSEP-CTERM sorting domain-containing protein [Spirochaetota bacterium]